MKTGAIVYVVDSGIRESDFNTEDAVKSLNLKADRVEVVFSQSQYFDIMDAWWSLAAKGMKLITCFTAGAINDSELKLTGRELKICG